MFVGYYGIFLVLLPGRFCLCHILRDSEFHVPLHFSGIEWDVTKDLITATIRTGIELGVPEN